ncbi:conjugal transfer protein [Bartonella phoceensis]|uniref:conjugal transfer protein n=1 Tax=Bartonella phoceensis TaxID=270249 RepID=UPI001ABBDA66|nr:conjugal transfer protein [Bartonella phoceensis]
MKQLSNFQSKNNSRSNIIAAVLAVFFMGGSLYASNILENAKRALDVLQIGISITILITITVILLCLVIGYLGHYIKRTMPYNR